MNKPGYFKSELRQCECGSSKVYIAKFFVWNVMCPECNRDSPTSKSKEEAIKLYNYRPAFDKAIDSLITYGHETAVFLSTGLTWPEALEIYKQRQEKKINE